MQTILAIGVVRKQKCHYNNKRQYIKIKVNYRHVKRTKFFGNKRQNMWNKAL